MKNKGITLIELLIVIVVLGIIATFAIVSVPKILDNIKIAATENELHIIEDASGYYTLDVGERPYGTLSGTGTCETWNQDSENTFILGTRGGSPIEGWSGPYMSKWAEETPMGGCYVYRSYKVGSQGWARSNWLRYTDNTPIGNVAPLDKDIELVMIRFYPLNSVDAIALSREVATFLLRNIDDTQIYYVNNQAVIGYYILPRD